MKQLRKQSGAQYISAYDSKLTGSNRRSNALVSLFCASLAVIFLFVTVFSSAASVSMTAHAEGDDSIAKLDEAAKSYGAEPDSKGFDKSYEKLTTATGPQNPDSFGYVLERLLATNYINYTPKGVAAEGKGNPGLNCNTGATGAGTLVYHNCDIPTITTEFLQDSIGLFMPTGPQNAETEVATIDNKWFGLPGSIPGDSVPVNPSLRAVKYTGLELYGYNLKYTNYAGEWDHIKVMTSARALANFGFMDSLKLSVTSVINGVTSGLKTSIANAAGSLSEGDIFGAIGGAYTGIFEGGASGGVNTILDTSDLNIVNTNAWYRVGFGKTLYNARELSQEELAASAKGQFLDMLTQSAPADASVPQDLQNAQNLPADPKEAISKCVYKDAAGKDATYGNVSVAPGPAEADCITMAQSSYDQRAAKHEAERADWEASHPDETYPVLNDKATYTWSADGTQKLETLESWKSTNSAYFTAADKYRMDCTLNTSEADRKNSLASFRACWPAAWASAADKAIKDVQYNLNNDWIKDKVNPEALSDWFAGNSDRNFNSPWARYICVDSSGKDILVNGRTVPAYDQSGKLNEKCGQLRAPIQNGFFGNGYIDDPSKPGYVAGRSLPAEDTRNKLMDTSIMAILLPMDEIMNGLSNTGLSIAVLATRISNTVINLTFSPILETLGISDTVVKIIKSLRDSLFFPLAVLVIGFSGLTFLFKAGKNRDYGQQGVSILIMVATFITGVMLMYRPEAMLKAVDEIPAMVEQAVVGSIFSAGSNAEDEVCTATGTAIAPTGTGLKGESLAYDPKSGTRSLMCENWRVFAFTPYIYGQWGTSFDSLYANSTSQPSKMQNTNAALVGNAGVNMGGGRTINNWGLYQLDVLSSGTSTDRNFSKPSGFVDSAFYRLVDLQAGPNNGAGTESRYLQSWSGNNGIERSLTGLMSALVGIIGMVTIVSFSIAKIEITFVSTLMLMFLPVMLLVGLHPTAGRMKLKGYIGTLASLMVQRVVIVIMLSIMLKIIIGVGTASTGYLLIAFTTTAVCILFLMKKKEILGMISKSFGDKFGAFGAGIVDNPRSAVASWMPLSVRNYAAQSRTAGVSIAAGAVGGYLSGNGAVKGARQAADLEIQKVKNIQRRKGYGAFQSAMVAAEAGKKDALDRAKGNENRKKILSDIAYDTDRGYASRVTERLSEKLPQDDESPAKAENAEDQARPKMDLLQTQNTAKTAREIAKLSELEQKINALKLEDQTKFGRGEDVSSIVKNDDINSIARDQSRLRDLRRGGSGVLSGESPLEADIETENSGEIERLEKKKHEIETGLIRRENRAFSLSSQKDEMKAELNRLVDEANEAIERANERGE
jgi:hypothetical protein